VDSKMVSKAIILAGGRGERLRPLTSDRPKPMIEVKGYPLLYHQMQWLKQFGIREIIISCGYLHEVIREYFQDGQKLDLSISYAIEQCPLGRGGGIKLASQYLTDDQEPVLVMNGDLLTDLCLSDLFSFHLNSKASATMVIVNLQSPYGIVQFDQEYYVNSFEEKPILPYWINAGIYVINHSALSEFPAQGDHEDNLFPKWAKERKLRAYDFKGFWRTIDTAKDLTELSNEIKIGPNAANNQKMFR
jgi:NDP-sugar pyrophosphorylase family protein